MVKTIYKYGLILWEDISEKRVMGTATNLTYSTLLAFVPIMAVVFAIARGFGYSMYIEEWFRDSLSSQPDAANTIIGFVNSYLVHTKKGIFLGIGLLFMLGTVLMLISNIELAFNDIWQVKRQRSLFRTITDYVSLLFFVPIVIVISSGLSIMVTTLNHEFGSVRLIGPVMSFFIELSPYVLWSLAFIGLYIFMPNTKVKLSSALLPGILAGVSMQVFQLIYINSQIWISNYNAIYGSFAIIPFFLLWLQASWIICLGGAELSYCRQNSDDFFANSFQSVSFQEKVDMSWEIMQYIKEKFMAGEKPYTELEIKKKVGKPMRIVKELLYDMQRINYIVEITYDEKGDTSHFLPAKDVSNVSKDDLMKELALLRPVKNN
ncbi:MAG: YihY/virulence factor BrkB family protein [Prevotella sp.]|nr:YihY/virulence factor BrkB family protein [Prevotella sp.]